MHRMSEGRREGGRNNGGDNADNVTGADNARDPGDLNCDGEREKEMKTRSLKIAGSNCRAHSVSLHFNASNFISSHFAFCKSYKIFCKSSSIEYMYSFKEVATGHFQTNSSY